MNRGSVWQQRRAVIPVLDRSPLSKKILVGLRWRLWSVLSWPVSMTMILVIESLIVFRPLAAVWWIPAGAAGPSASGVGFVWGAIPRNGWGALAVALVAGAVAAGVVGAKQQVDMDKVARVKAFVRWFLGVAVVAYTAFDLGWWFPVLFAVLPACWATDVLLGRHVERIGLIRVWAQWRRELPSQHAVLASATKNIQSDMDSSIEQNLTLAARVRPVLEAPGMHLWGTFDFNAWTVEQRVFPTPGRNLEALRKLLPMMSANMPTIADHEDSLAISVDEGAHLEWATSGLLRVHFKPGGGERFMLPPWLSDLPGVGWAAGKVSGAVSPVPASDDRGYPVEDSDVRVFGEPPQGVKAGG